MEEIKELLAITQKLRDKYIHLNKQFSLDGKLVGDIGEVLAAEKYGLKLLGENAEIYDAQELETGRMVQIKSSFKGNSYFPFGEERIPDYFLSIVINEEGEISELFNGPGQFIMEKYINVRNIKPYKNHYYTLSKGVLKELNELVEEKDKIKILPQYKK
jgi:molybdopterin converting factor small subunit